MKITLHGNATALELADGSFGVPFNEALVHQVVIAYMAHARSGTKAQKSRADVRGGGIKPWRQKGTGRARAGSSRSPLWSGGGQTFAARPRNHAQKVNRKMYRGAMRSVLSELLRRERLIIVEDFAVEEAKTRLVSGKLKDLGVESALIVVEGFEAGLWLGARNIPGVEVVEAREVDPVSLVGAEHVVMTVAAARLLEERLA